MAKKFFYNRVYNTKRTIVNFVIIGVCVIGIVLCFILTSNFQAENQNEPQGSLSIKKEVTVEVNEDFNNEVYFSKIENVDVNKLDIKYPDDYSITKTGVYNVIITINDTEYPVKLNIVDTTKPTLTLKKISIIEGTSYSAKDFVESCVDNSKSDCTIAFYSGMDEDGNKVQYDSYKNPGTYSVKIVATDKSNNQTVEEAKLVISKKNSSTTPDEKPATCKYGNGEYDKDSYTLAISITSNNCAVSIDSYKDSEMTKDINKLMDTETTKIKKDIEALNLVGTLALNRKVSAIVNNAGTGVVGYELRMTVTLTNNDGSKIAADYKIDSSGNRVFIENPYKLK